MPYPSRYTVRYTVTTHHEVIVDVPEEHRPTGEPWAMGVVRRMDSLALRANLAVGTSSYVLKAVPLEEVPGAS